MAGEKGKSGSQGGKSNNPFGRPKGSKNKYQSVLKDKIAQFLEKDFDNFVKEIQALPPVPRVRAKNDLLKLVIPRPLNEEESQLNEIQNRFVNALFNKKEKDED